MLCKIFKLIQKFMCAVCGCDKEEQTPAVPVVPPTDTEKPSEEIKPTIPPTVEKPAEKPVEKPSQPATPETNKVNTKLFVLLDNGHGKNTAGKHSPDKSLYEWTWNREMVKRIKTKLDALGIKNEVVVPGDTDISLTQRCNIINEKCNAYGKSNCLMISVHVNAAAGDSKWHDANGWSVFVAPNASTSSKKFAQMLYAQAQKFGLQGNRSVPTEKYWVGNFTIIKNTVCPAVLTENMFQDNKKDVEYLLSEKGKETIAQLHINAILEYIKYKGI